MPLLPPFARPPVMPARPSAKARARSWRRLLFGGALIMLAPPGQAQPAPQPAPQQGWGLPQLMSSLAQVHGASARFTERKTIGLLSAPLIASGTLQYRAPDWMRKTTVSPLAEDFVLDHGQVTLSGHGATHVLPLAAAPPLAALAQGIIATLAGDLPALDRAYAVRLGGNPAAWRLLLRPADTATLRWISIYGSRNRITAIDTAATNGDHSEMSVTEIIDAD